jgi:hypothetical protein
MGERRNAIAAKAANRRMADPDDLEPAAKFVAALHSSRAAGQFRRIDAARDWR